MKTPRTTTTPATAPPQPAGTMDPRAYLHALVDTVPEAMLAPLAAWLEAELAYRTGQMEAAPRWH